MARQSDILFFLSVFLPLVAVYGLTANWSLPYDPDALSNVVAAWHLGNTGSVVAPGYEHLTVPPQHGAIVSFIMSPHGPVSKYPPGAAMLSAPLYALEPSELNAITIGNPARPDAGDSPFLLPAIWPATLSSVLATAAAMGLLGLTFRQIGAAREAWVGAIIAGLGTSAWSVASAQLFQHGPAMLWIALGVYLCSQQRYWSAGLAFGATVLTRPITAVIPATMGTMLGAYERNLTPIVRIGFASLLGVAALLVYSLLIYEQLSITAGYGNGVSQKLVDFDLIAYLINILGSLFFPSQGFLLLSPFLLLLIPGLAPAWSKSQPWVRASAMSGLIYLLLHLKLNRFDPANTTLYRYPLEALTASASLWFLAYDSWLKDARASWRRLWPKAVVLSIGIQGVVVWVI